jgi:DNA-binding CsgD family transcriptional regulator
LVFLLIMPTLLLIPPNDADPNWYADLRAYASRKGAHLVEQRVEPRQRVTSASGQDAVPALHALTDGLTLRQKDVLALVATGHTSKHIARALGISEKTVESHRARLRTRLGVARTAGLIGLAAGAFANHLPSPKA